MDTILPPFFWPTGSGTEPAGPPPPGRPVLGHDGATWFVVVADGGVASVDPTSPLATCFVNSSSPHFFSCLDAFADCQRALEGASGDEALTAIGGMRHELNRVDISALGDRTNWWAVILDQLEERLP